MLDRERDDARRFLLVYEVLDPRDAPPLRERRIEELSVLPLQAASVRRARDACVSAHRALIAVEESQEAAQKALDLALQGRTDGRPLDQKQVEGVRQSLAAADTALSRARAEFVPCETEARSLALRFGER